MLQYTRYTYLCVDFNICPVLFILSFGDLIFQALAARLLEGTGVNANNGIISGVLVTVGDLARVVGESVL